MSKTHQILIGLLAFQLVLAVMLNSGDTELQVHAPNAALLSFDENQITRVELSGPDGKTLMLKKEDQGWVLPDKYDFPVDKTKMTTVLSQLANLKYGLPSATSSAASKRFKVDEDAFERRIQLFNGEEELAALYLGTSPGVRRSYVRRPNEESIYDVTFGIFDLPIDAGQWQDKTILQFPKENIKSLEIAGMKLDYQSVELQQKEAETEAKTSETQTLSEKENKQWVAENLTAGEVLNQEAVDTLADKLAGLRIGDLLGMELKPEYGLDEPVLALPVELDDGQTIQYRFGKQEDQYILKSSNHDAYFSLPSYLVEPIIQAAKRENLVNKHSS